MPGVVTHPGELADHHRDPFQGPQVGVEPIGHHPGQQGLLDPGQVASRQIGVGAGRATTPQGLDTAPLEAGVPDMGALAGDTELAGDLGLGAALGEQLGRLQASGLEGGAVIGRAGAAGSRHRRTLTRHLPSRQPNPRNSIRQRFEGLVRSCGAVAAQRSERTAPPPTRGCPRRAPGRHGGHADRARPARR
jgi:hypothetical protein